MNSVLSTLTWGTWDDSEWGLTKDATPAFIATATIRKLRRKGLQAPKNSQLWFEELLERVEGTSFGCSKSCYHCNPLKCLHISEKTCIEIQQEGIPWADLPDGIHPQDGKLPAERARNKRQQVDNLAVFLRRILRPGDVVVEFCAGSGYVALPLACLFPQCKFVLLDKKEPSLAIAKERIAAAQLTNVEIFCGFIDDYHKPFDVGIALHACGEATDMVMQKCLAERAAYVLAPCCVGKIKLSELSYPRSAALAAELSRTEYEVLAKAADFGHSSNTTVAHSDINRRRRRCKTLLESDRNMRAEEAQYDTSMFVMYPPTATPKNDVLVGIPRNLTAEQGDRLFQLECEAVLSTDALVRKAMLGA
ncbi:glutathione S-transferase C-terminal domain-containing protein, putative [Phytophthora infestans T30-4]|uniref:Glutathione S-transferase C-terminal domain-containing protein, putative n=1 Tax=Phytophthora infestans (strain T30-4) TaxID=403677 RepID=D0NWG7_PHYIT|nr:glutathione S-transferase C-terminal domain-containing protein, putative [Phytophthora infestans T30-4]EEY67023.1 glutathione S-transferase C-terminal domain-containing protein, putative [Phytophthora infestans T30-4]|eukprot:XP_002896577.1 glutathione S-transferase C-terminal domain-containing protein, putative [Phytophthora infestans T30-4]